MSHNIHDLIARGEARVVQLPEAPAATAMLRHQVETDRNFGLPKALYAATVACYLGFLAVVGTAFASPHMAIPLAICVVFIVAGFGVPAVWTRLAGNTSAPQTMGEFGLKGIMTHTGRLAPRDAAIQVLILPVLLVVWGLAMAVIAAIVT